MQCSAPAAGSFAETVVVSDTDGGESLTLHVIYQSESDSVTLCTQLEGPPAPVCAGCLQTAAGRACVSVRDELLYVTLHV